MKNKDPEILGAFREFEINSTIRFRQELDTQTYTRPYAGCGYYMYLQTNTRAVLSGKYLQNLLGFADNVQSGVLLGHLPRPCQV